MADALEREDWESLVKSPGWRRLVGQFRTRYDAGVLEQRIKAAQPTPEGGFREAVNWLCEKQGVYAVLDFPDLRIRQLRDMEARLK